MSSDSTTAWYRRPAFWLRSLLGVVVIVSIVLGSILGWLKLHESELVFHTAESHQRTGGQLPADAERLSIADPDGEQLAALMLRADAAHDSGFWVLHLHGNADSAFSTNQLEHSGRLRELGLNVLVFDYRGFGLSPGVASEPHIEEDAEAAYQELIRRSVPPQKIIIWGHSLGSGPAVFLASRHPVAALVLFGAFTSVPDVAQDTYRNLPVRWLTGVHFNSIALIAQVHAPVLIAHSSADTIILFHHGKQLFAAANEPKRFFELAAPYSDNFGGHVNALYDQLQVIAPTLAAMTGAQLAD